MWLRDLIVRDFWLKLFSLAVAVLIRITVSIAIQNEIAMTTNTAAAVSSRTFTNLSVAVVSSASDVHGFKVNPNCVEVVVRGEADVLSRLTEKDVRATVDLTNVESARSLRKRVDVSTPPGVILVRLFPSDVDVVAPSKE
jgi:hypothetical protein